MNLINTTGQTTFILLEILKLHILITWTKTNNERTLKIKLFKIFRKRRVFEYVNFMLVKVLNSTK